MHSETHECLTSETSKLNFSTGMAVNVQGGPSGMLGNFGSGSGGGPSEEGKPHQSSPASGGIDELEKELEQILQTFGMKGSGSGGLITEILESSGKRGAGEKASASAAMVGLGNDAGHLSMITGDSIVTRLGAEFEHCFNANIKISADIEEMIAGLLVGVIGLNEEAILSLLWGSGGYCNQVYGNRQTVTYGHDLKIRRGQELVFCLLYTSPSPRDRQKSRMPSSA